jgi:hypothetical protein
LGPLRDDGGGVVEMYIFMASVPRKQLLAKFGFTPGLVSEAHARGGDPRQR